MTTSRTKNDLLFSLLVLSVTIGTFGFLVYQIHTKGNQIEEYLAVISERTAQETSFIRVRKMIQETEAERSIIDSAFFKDESESIHFLGEIEKLADTIGLDLKTESLDKVAGSDKKTECIKITFSFKGNKKDVLGFTKLLENLSYHSWIDALTLGHVIDNIWEGRLTLFITITPS